MTAIIRVEGLSKCYRVQQRGKRAPYGTLRESLTEWALAPVRRWTGGGSTESWKEFWALKDVSLEVRPGEVLGIVGVNGAGKSTLLKILSRITRPTAGEVDLRGRVGSLLEVGTGFHPELTGRENIFLNGSILGMSRREIGKKFDEIVDFAGVETFLDTPVKRYSSGMYTRLAFAVAAHLDPEILLVDEVLAVGDQAFQNKCAGKMGSITASGRTIILVSHNLAMLTRLSTAVAWLREGRIEAVGSPTEVVRRYCEELTCQDDGSGRAALHNHRNRLPGKPVQMLEEVSLSDEQGMPTTAVPLGGTLNVDLKMKDMPGRSDTTVVIDVSDMFGTQIAQAHSQIQSALDLSGRRAATVRCQLRDIRFVPGRYNLSVAVGDCDDYLDRVNQAISFTVEQADLYGTGRIPIRKFGLVAVTAQWQLRAEHGVPSHMAGDRSARNG